MVTLLPLWAQAWIYRGLRRDYKSADITCQVESAAGQNHMLFYLVRSPTWSSLCTKPPAKTDVERAER